MVEPDAASRVEAVLKELHGLSGFPHPPARGGKDRKRRSSPSRISVLPCRGEDIPGREEIRKLRRLAPASWRGGWAIPFAVAEQGNPRWLLEVLQRTRRDSIIQFPPLAPFLDPLLISQMIAEADEHPATLARLSTAAPGIAGDVFRRPLLEDTARRGLPADYPMRFVPDRPERFLENKQVFHWFPEEISGFGARLTAESRLGISLLKGVDGFPGAGGETGPPGDWLQRLSREPEILAGPVPREIRFQITSRTRTASPLDPVHPAERVVDLSPELFLRACRELGEWQECRVVISGGEPLLHPEVEQILQAARSGGAGAVVVETDGRGLDSRSLDLLCAGADVVLVAVDARTPETYRALKGVDALDEVEGGVEMLLGRSAAAGGWPVVAVQFRVVDGNRHELEPFFDRWYPRTSWVVVREPSDRAGQVSFSGLQPARTPDRIPCIRILDSLSVLPDGRVAACDNDFCGFHPVGDLKDSTPGQIWTGPELQGLRAAHARMEWDQHPLCSRCSDWCRR